MLQRYLALIILCSALTAIAQDSIPNKKRINVLKYGGLATYTVGLLGFNQLWYTQSPRTSFHFFNDAKEWKQMDKAGHFFSAFHLSATTHQTLKWASAHEKKHMFISSFIGFSVLSTIEIFDGFSPDYGASLSDLAANATGSLLFIGQMAAWDHIRIQPKFSFTRSGLAAQRPNVLGSNIGEEILKDYNGQTYWLSADMDKFIRFPKWLNLALGYGASNMIYGRDAENAAQGIYPKRQFYLSLDFDVTAIHTQSKCLKALIYLVNMVKLPAPALEFSKNGIKAHALYF